MEKKSPIQSLPQLVLLKDVWSACKSAQLNQSSHLAPNNVGSGKMP